MHAERVVFAANPVFAELPAKRCPDAEVVCGEAADLPKFLADRGTPSADLIISTLPWVAFAPSATQRPLLATVVESLVSGGTLYPGCVCLDAVGSTGPSPTATASASFEEVVISETIWRNVAPCSRLYRQAAQERAVDRLIIAVPDAGTRLSSDTGRRRLINQRRCATYSTRSMVRVVPLLSKVTTTAPSAIGPSANS